MATNTPNLNLKKPSGTDYVKVADLNGNMEVLDTAIGKMNQLNTPNKTSIVEAVNDAARMGGDKAPFIGLDGYWYQWDTTTMQYVNTGELARTAQSIPAGTDLNTYLTPGNFYCEANVTAATLWNCPTANAFALEVLRHAGATGVRQILVEYMPDGTARRLERNTYAGVYEAWTQTWPITPQGMPVGRPLFNGVAATSTVLPLPNFRRYTFYVVIMGGIDGCLLGRRNKNVFYASGLSGNIGLTYSHDGRLHMTAPEGSDTWTVVESSIMGHMDSREHSGVLPSQFTEIIGIF